MTPLHGKSLGILLSVSPAHPGFNYAIGLARTALNRGVRVYLYCVDEAVLGLAEPDVLQLHKQGLHLFACAYAAERRHLSLDTGAAFSGLGTASNLMADTDRFVSFN